MSDSEFDRVWYGHCPDEAAPKPVALGPEPLRDDGATWEFTIVAGTSGTAFDA